MTLSPALSRPLADCFSALLAYVVDFRQGVENRQPPYEEVRSEILRLLKESETAVARGDCPPKDYDQARYAVCAWIDESVLASGWAFKGRWRPDRLERLYYQSADAGESFFTRLKSFEAPEQGVREIYALCLALGFKGQYCAPDDLDTLAQIKERQLKLLYNSLSESPSVAAMEKNILFPESYPSNLSPKRAGKLRRSWGWTAVILGPVLILAGLLLTYRFTLSHVGLTLLKAVRS
jgi:type VI secretion system protein ImpK